MLSEMRKLYLAALAGDGPAARLIASATASRSLPKGQQGQEIEPQQDIPSKDGAENEGG